MAKATNRSNSIFGIDSCGVVLPNMGVTVVSVSRIVVLVAVVVLVVLVAVVVLVDTTLGMLVVTVTGSVTTTMLLSVITSTQLSNFTTVDCPLGWSSVTAMHEINSFRASGRHTSRVFGNTGEKAGVGGTVTRVLGFLVDVHRLSASIIGWYVVPMRTTRPAGFTIGLHCGRPPGKSAGRHTYIGPRVGRDRDGPSGDPSVGDAPLGDFASASCTMQRQPSIDTSCMMSFVHMII